MAGISGQQTNTNTTAQTQPHQQIISTIFNPFSPLLTFHHISPIAPVLPHFSSSYSLHHHHTNHQPTSPLISQSSINSSFNHHIINLSIINPSSTTPHQSPPSYPHKNKKRYCNITHFNFYHVAITNTFSPSVTFSPLLPQHQPSINQCQLPTPLPSPHTLSSTPYLCQRVQSKPTFTIF